MVHKAGRGEHKCFFEASCFHSETSSSQPCCTVCFHGAPRLMDRKTAELLNEYKAHMNLKYKVGSCLSPDMQWLVSGSEDAGVQTVRWGQCMTFCCESLPSHRGHWH